MLQWVEDPAAVRNLALNLKRKLSYEPATSEFEYDTSRWLNCWKLPEASSKNGFWFVVAAGPSFPATLDFPSVCILFVGHKPQEYACVLRI